MANNALDLKTDGKWDQTKGRIKEAWGTLTDDELDQSEGKWDRLVGTIKEKTGDTVEMIEERLHGLLDKIKDAGRN